MKVISTTRLHAHAQSEVISGIDLCHNPEFTICEFYEPFASLANLIERTEMLIRSLALTVEGLKSERLSSLPSTDIKITRPFKRLDFVSTIESTINRKLPNLRLPSATAEMIELFRSLQIPLPADPNLPRLLDELAALYIEPLCIEPTFVLHHPEPLSPLAKSFYDSSCDQYLSARAELFIKGREYVNCYEEENSPFEQRRKFEDQARFQAAVTDWSQRRISATESNGTEDSETQPTSYQASNEGFELDESYLEALEWGLPPTGGWGCGVDRLVMLFSGAKRIADVLSFGTLRNVVALDERSREGGKARKRARVTTPEQGSG
jgi:lysyl-tRNA synthetase, class II